MKDIYHVVEYMKFLVNKDSYYKSPQEIAETLHHAQMGLFAERLGNPAKYQLGHPVSPISYQVTKRVSEDLRPFLEEAELDVLSGVVVLPQGFVYPTSIRASRTGNEISALDDDKVASRLASALLPVTKTHPVCEILKDGYRVYPDTVEKIFLKYLKAPSKPVYAVKEVEDEEMYDDEASVDLQWGPIAQQEVIFRALQSLGVNLRDQNITQFSQFKASQGGA